VPWEIGVPPPLKKPPKKPCHILGKSSVWCFERVFKVANFDFRKVDSHRNRFAHLYSFEDRTLEA
jgi:hypothetical protein